MINFIKQIPIIQYLIWFRKKKYLQRKNKFLHMGYFSQVNQCLFKGKVDLAPYSNINNCTIGTHVRIGEKSKLCYCNISSYSVLGPECLIGLGIHPTEYISTQNFLYQKNYVFSICPDTFNFKFKEYKITTIGSDVWIGARVIIPGGIHIGNGAIIAAGSIVTKNVPPYAIMAGCPAKIIRYRFDHNIIDRLLEIEWWKWDLEKIKMNHSLFFDIKKFIETNKLH